MGQILQSLNSYTCYFGSLQVRSHLVKGADGGVRGGGGTVLRGTARRHWFGVLLSTKKLIC